jgi:glycosyltransferase involved in cell wall biosynthesis
VTEALRSSGASSARMEGHPAVTVIVPTRNRSSYLGDCLGSLARQRSRLPFEILVVDNDSTDDTAHVIEQWCQDDPRFRGMLERRVGLSSAKNAGVRSARGWLLLFTDDDAIVEEGWIDSYLEVFSGSRPEMMVAGGPVVPIPGDLGGWPGWFQEAHLPDLALLDYGSERQLRGFEYVWGGNMAVPASLFERLGPWDETIGRRGEERGTFEDTEYQDRVRGKGGVVWFCPGAVVRHRIVRQQITPHQVILTAFARGRNDYARERLYGSGNSAWLSAHWPWARLGSSLLRWLWWAALFRAARSKGTLERARRAAWSSGWWLDRARWGRESTPFSRILGRVTFRVRALALRLAPRHPNP